MTKLSFWQILLSRFLGGLANWRYGGPLKNWAIRCYIRYYQIDMSEAVQTDIRQFPTFNAFFTRALQPDARPLPSESHWIISPVDGRISEIGQLQTGQVLQAKNKYYSLMSLLGDYEPWVKPFMTGQFLTAYLAPKDYHRIHMPIAGTLTEMMYVPGCLFPVHHRSVAQVDQLFARNERVICCFNTAIGPMVMVLVGALIVGSISTVWHGSITPPHGGMINAWHYPSANLQFAQGAEIGHFNLGSTVIVLFPAQTMNWFTDLKAETPLRMGQTIGTINPAFLI